jgi:threonyl-tRNA synthetase
MQIETASISIKLPDGSIKQVPANFSGMDLAKSISPGLAKKAVAIEVNGELQDLQSKLTDQDLVKIITVGDKRSYEVLRHTTSHLMAMVVQKLFPGAKVGVGPATENGFFYDFRIEDKSLNDSDLIEIEKEMKRVASSAYELKKEFISEPEKVITEYKNQGEIYKAELLEEHRNDNPTEYYFVDSNGQKLWSDLCAGPHLPNTKFIKAIKLMSVAGTNWRAKTENDQMQRVYGTAWWTEEELENFLKQKEEAEKRDHRKLAKLMDLFSIHEVAGAGLVHWHNKLATIRMELEDFWKKEHRRAAYDFVVTPHIAKSDLWDISGHNSFYKDNMYSLKVDEQEYILKPMNCPFHVLIYKNSKHSYRELPIRMAELGTVYRNEASGAVHGLARVRGFTQDDAHIFCSKDQFVSEIQGVFRLVDKIYKTLGLSFEVEVSTKPEKAIGEDELWDFAEKGLMDSLKELKIDFEINPGDGAFYGPKIDFKLKDALGRTWQGATIQLDFNLPERFNLTFVNSNNQEERPVMIHRAIYGSMERISMLLIEHFAGAFPAWLAPEQVIVLPIADRHNEYAKEIESQLLDNDIRAISDLRSERMNYKIREAQEKQIPYMIIVGDEELKSQTINLRSRRSKEQVEMRLEEFSGKITQEIKSRSLNSFM